MIVFPVGLDDFARHLTGRADAVELPVRGAHIEKGAAAGRVCANDREAGLASPAGGEVVQVNAALRENPALATDDPYGRGWLMKVRVANPAAQMENLLDGRIARRWMDDARTGLGERLAAPSGFALRDGGEPAPDFADHVDPETWKCLRATFLLD